MTVQILEGDCITSMATLPDQSIQCVVTSPPYYGLRNYEVEGQIGLEDTPEAYVEKLISVFREVKRVLKDDGTLWLNLGDSYWGGNMTGGNNGINSQGTYKKDRQFKSAAKKTNLNIKPKDLIGIPWMVAFALRADGWYLRQDIIWAKSNPMPESVRDRCTKAHEYIFLLSKSAQYYYDFEALLEPAVDRPTDSWEKRKAGGASSGSVTNGHNSSLAKGKGFSHTLGGYGLTGTGFKGHSGNNDADGNPLGHSVDGIPARNKRGVWTVTTKPYKGAHFATFPPDLIEPCILAGSKEGDTILDPFNGSGTTGEVSIKHRRNYIGCELNPEYIQLTYKRLAKVQPILIPK